MCSTPAARQQEREVGDGAAGGGGLLAVVDALDEAGGAQHVVGHALAPLATGLRAGQGLAQVLGGVGQAGCWPSVACSRPVDERAVLLGGSLLQRADHLGAPARARGASRRPAARRWRCAGRARGSQREVIAELVAGHGEHGVDGLLQRPLAVGSCQVGGLVGELVANALATSTPTRAAPPRAATRTAAMTRADMAMTVRRGCDGFGGPTL